MVRCLVDLVHKIQNPLDCLVEWLRTLCHNIKLLNECRINYYNSHSFLHLVKVLEACVKNCGAPMHKEVATKEIMDCFRELAKVSIKLTSSKF